MVECVREVTAKKFGECGCFAHVLFLFVVFAAAVAVVVCLLLVLYIKLGML